MKIFAKTNVMEMTHHKKGKKTMLAVQLFLTNVLNLAVFKLYSRTTL